MNAILARPNSVSLAGAMISMLNALQDPVWAARARARSREMAAQWTIEHQSQEFVKIYEDLAAGRPVALTEGLHPDHGRPPFPGRTVTAPYAPPSASEV